MGWNVKYSLQEIQRLKQQVLDKGEVAESDMIEMDIWDMNFVLNLAEEGIQAIDQLAKLKHTLEELNKEINPPVDRFKKR